MYRAACVRKLLIKASGVEWSDLNLILNTGAKKGSLGNGISSCRTQIYMWVNKATGYMYIVATGCVLVPPRLTSCAFNVISVAWC